MPKQFGNDIILLDELKKRNAKAYEYLYNTTIVRLSILAVSILKNEEQAKDLLQEFFSDLWEHRLYENVNVSLKAYLYYTVRNRAFRFKKVNKGFNLVIESMGDGEPSETPQYFENEELGSAINAAMDKLSPMPYKTFKMHYIEELSHQQIAEILGISKQTVSNHIHKALTDLRSHLKKNAF